MSRKTTDSFEISWENFIDLWHELRCVMKVSSSCSDLSQSIQISSIYLCHAKGWFGQL